MTKAPDRVERPAHEPIAVIGLSCRLPGAADPSAYRRLLQEGRCAIGPAPQGRASGHVGGHLDDVAGFDPAVFGMSPRAAAAADPQHRLALELAWEALDDAGADGGPDTRRRTGVVLGAMSDDYAALHHRRGLAPDQFTLLGQARSLAANRISHALRLRGPSLVVDSGQSSSLVAVHLACGALHRRECDVALAGGVHLVLDPGGTAATRAFGALSPTGTSRPFDARADGYVRGEGGALVVLKRLSDALADGDRVDAVVLGGAVNNDGGGDLTVPQAAAQVLLLRAAHDAAGVSPEDIGYVEAHGTGTPVGDPVEAAALAEVFGPRETPLLVGSVKGSIGHLEGAAGIAGLVKTVLALREGGVPATPGHEGPPADLPLHEWGLAVPTRTEPWPAGARCAGVSSFGMGGTNCHLVVSPAPDAEAGGPAPTADPRAATPPALCWPLSAADPETLAVRAGQLAEALRDRHDVATARTLAASRRHLRHRAVVTTAPDGDPTPGLRALAEGLPAADVALGQVREGHTAFVFTGQGAQRLGMGLQLRAAHPVFAEAFDEASDLLSAELGADLRHVVRDGGLIDETKWTQAALFAHEVALSRLLASWGVRPDLVAGHSVGEFAAAHVAGMLTLPQAARLVAARGSLMQELPTGGAMLSLEADADTVAGWVEAAAGVVAIAAVNGPTALVVSGADDAVASVEDAARSAGCRTRRLRVSHAFHSPLMDPMLERFRAAAEAIGATRAGTIPLVSGLDGRPRRQVDADYWTRHVSDPVRFLDAVRGLEEGGAVRILEVGPASVLTGAVSDSLADGRGAVGVALQRKDREEAAALAEGLAAHHAHGGDVDWGAFYAGTGTDRVALPPYPFRRRPLWLDGLEPGGAPAETPVDADADPLDVPVEAEGAERAGAATDPGPDGTTAPTGGAATLPAGSPWRGAARTTDPGERERRCRRLVVAHVGAVLGVGPDEVDASATLRDLGIDSQTALELRRELSAGSGVDVRASDLFDHPTPTRLAAHLAAALGPDRPADASPSGGPAGGSASGAIAIVSMACRFPGGVADPEGLWRLLAHERDAVGPFPQDRGWDLDTLYDPDPDVPGRSWTREGGFLEDLAGFDAAFFGVSGREALATDPQQRLLLELAWEALERAPIAPDGLEGSRTGVFIGTFPQPYGPPMTNAGENLEGYLLTGTTTSVASGRIAYTLGLRGPALTVDTACSASLVGVHLACQSLRRGESDLALAGGVTAMPDPGIFVELTRQRALSPTGRCRAFSADADGTGWAEGAGLVLLERLEDALAAGHEVLAVIAGSAVNQDGASNGLTAPSGAAQQEVLRAALADADLAPGDVDAVEAHGTGTKLGDPIEANALAAVYGAGRDPQRPLLLGSLKSNLGHTQAAAGVGGLIKSVLALRHGTLPRTLHVTEPTPHVDWDTAGLRLITAATPWPDTGRPKRVGVSSFGISGTNCHVIVQEPPAAGTDTPADDTSNDDIPADDTPADDTPADDRPGTTRDEVPATILGLQAPYVLSAASPTALQESARRLADALESAPDGADAPTLAAVGPTLAAVGRTLALGRARHAHRCALLAADRTELVRGLRTAAAGQEAPGLVGGLGAARARVAFVFPGQGSQWPRMAEGLWRVPAFADHVDACDAALREFVDFSVADVLRRRPGAPDLERVDVLQPALFTMMSGLGRLWQLAGIEPDVVVGHSQGEIAAAYLAGALTLRDAALVVARRSQCWFELRGLGAMTSVTLPMPEVVSRLEPWADRLGVGARNSAGMVAVSGDPEALEAFEAALRADDVTHRRIAGIDTAGHSPQVDRFRDRLLAELASVAPLSDAPVTFVSTVTGGPLDPGALDAEYWFRNMREPVDLLAATRHLLDDGVDAFVEVSPHPLLAAPLQETIGEAATSAVVLSTLRRDSEPDRFDHALAEASVAGVEPDWDRLFGTGPRAQSLPTYPFERQRFWLAPSTSGGADVDVAAVPTGHAVVGAAIDVAGAGPTILSGRVDPDIVDWAEPLDRLLPNSVLLDVASAAAERVGLLGVRCVDVQAPLDVRRGPRLLQVAVENPDEDGDRALTIHSRRPGEDEGAWTLHATGVLSPAVEAAHVPGVPPSKVDEGDAIDLTGAARAAAVEGRSPASVYDVVRSARRHGAVLVADIDVEAGASGHVLHPGVLAALESLLDVLDGEGFATRFTGLEVLVDGAGAVRAHVHDPGDGSRAVVLVDAEDRPVARAVLSDRRPLPEQVHPDAGRLLTEVTERPGRLGDARPGHVVALDAVGTPDGALAAAVRTAADEHRADLPDLLAALDGGASVPDVIAVAVDPPPAADPPAAVREATAAALRLLQDRSADARLAGVRLLLAVPSARDADDPGRRLAIAAVAGLVRAAQAEDPDRIVLVHVDVEDDGDAANTIEADALRAVGVGSDPEVRIADGDLRVPTLRPVAEGSQHLPAAPETGTILVTGGTGTLGAAVARHLAQAGHRRILLVSRRGPDAPGAADLVEELAGLGAQARVAACDTADRAEVAALLDGVDPQHPLRGVVHTAGVLADGLVGALDPDRLDAVLRPKVDAAWHLHDLTRDEPLDLFVLYSSMVGTFGGPGQANYAAANAALDALARVRAAEGLPATSVAWGFWAQRSGMSAHLSDEDIARMAAVGVRPLDTAAALEALRVAIAAQRPAVLAVDLDRAALRRRSGDLGVPAVLRDLAGPSRRTAAGPDADDASDGGFTDRLRHLPPADRSRISLDVVREAAAATISHPSAAAIDPQRPFKEIGFDSLTAVELRNRLQQATGQALPTSLVFDHPTPADVAEHLVAETVGDDEVAPVPAAPAPAAASAQEDPVVLVGMTCRLPGGVRDPEGLWAALVEGRDLIGGFPTDRGWSDDLYDPDGPAPGRTYSDRGGFLDGAGDFDAAFFNISPREALAMDPQQRLLLEASWEAVERAHIDPQSLAGAPVGIYIGTNGQEYVAPHGQMPAELEGYLVTGKAASVASGRIAYTLGTVGPAVTLDTACSSSLVALHLARRALLAGECDLALAGGVTIMATPSLFVEFSRQRALARDGRCKAFSDDADGTSWAEGVVVVVLERLSRARALGHEVLAVVRGSAINQDGASNGLTAPNGPSQQRVIAAALADAALSATDVDVIEAHGTGTVLGDPIEAQALLATYGQRREAPAWLGALKATTGHTQAAAGLAGVVKIVLALREGLLPRTLHAQHPTTHVDWSAGAIRLAQEDVPWPAGEQPRRAGVSGFGISGTNAHVLLEEAPADSVDAGTDATHGDDTAADTDDTHTDDTRADDTDDTDTDAGADGGRGSGGEDSSAQPAAPTPYLISARTPAALRAAAGALHDRLDRLDQAGTDPVALARSLATTRGVFEERAAVIATTADEARAGLAALARGEKTTGLVAGTVHPGATAFIFTGQGSQRAGMGLAAAAAFPDFARALADVDAHLRPHLGRPIEDILADPEAMGRTGDVQPALFAVEVALARWLLARGVQPDTVAGHSIGEIAAAHIAGILDLADAAALVTARGALMQALPAGGAMAAVRAAEQDVAALLDPDLPIGIAAVNSPTSCVVSGPAEAVDDVVAAATQRGLRTRRLEVSHAFHSPLMEPMLDEFRQVVGGLTFTPPTLSFVPSAGTPDADPCDPEYWVRHVRDAVRFGAATSRLLEAGVTRFVEVGPDAALTPSVRENLEAASASDTAIPTLRRERDEPTSLVTALASIHVDGGPVDRATLFAPGPVVDLPTYPFHGSHYWHVPGAGAAPSRPGGSALDRALTQALEGSTPDEFCALLGITPSTPLEEVLARWAAHRPAGEEPDGPEAWCYRLGWEHPTPAGDEDGGAPASPVRTRVLLVPRGIDAAAALAAGLRDALPGLPPARGAATVEVVEVDLPTEDPVVVLERALTAAPAAAGDGVVAVTSLLGLDETPDPAHGGLGRGLLATALVCAGLAADDRGVRLDLVTTGAYRLDGDEIVRPAQTAVWGLARVLGLERPGLLRTIADLPADAAAHAPETAGLAELLAHPGRDDQVAVRGGETLVPRLRRTTPGPALTTAAGTALVTGGLGGLGRHVTRDLAARGVDRIVLVGRRGMETPGAAQFAQELRAGGVTVLVESCDVADAAELSALVERIEAEGPITAVHHAAGVVELRDLADTDAAGFTAVCAGKILGAASLDRVFADRDLHEFVLYSSVAATWGSGGQGAYAAGNAYLDGLAAARRARGATAVAIAWGPWADDGMITGDGIEEHLVRRGLLPMPPAEALEMMRRVVGGTDPHVVVADLDWPRFLVGFEAASTRPLVDHLRDAPGGSEPDDAPVPDAPARLRDRLTDLSPDERRHALVTLVREHTADILRHADPGDVGADRVFKDLGFDSLMSVELRDRIVAETGLALSAMLVFDHPDPRSLAGHLDSELFGPPAESGADDPLAVDAALAPPPDVEARLADGDADDVFRLIDELGVTHE